MSLFDDAYNSLPYGADLGEALRILTADGPVILLPDEGDGVKVARLEDAWRSYHFGDFPDLDAKYLPQFVKVAHEVAE